MHQIEISQAQPWYIILSILLIGLNAFFVAAEFALVKIRATRLEILAQKGNPIYRLAYKMASNLDPYLSATQLGITLASLALGWVGEPTVAKIITPFIKDMGLGWGPETIGSVSFAVGFSVISSLHIILGELVPKSIAIQTAERVCLFIALPLHVFYIIFFPFLWILNSISNLVLRIFRFNLANEAERAHSEEELKLILEDSFEAGAIAQKKRELLDKAIDFSHKTIHQIMVPLHEMVCFHLSASIQENLDQAKDSGHTRFPLKESPQGRFLGFVHMKDIIWSFEHGEVINLFDLNRPVILLPHKKRLDHALIEFQTRKIHMALVQGEENQVIGMLTLEDVIEELVGEIEDEFDTED